MLSAENRNIQPFLDRLTARSVLTEAERQAILSLPGHARQVEANVDFVALGDRVDHACLIVAGVVGRFDQNWEGARQITAIHVPGDMVDLHSVVQTQATSALQALSVATILRIPHSAIKSAMARYPALAEVLWRDCMVDAAILSQWVANVGRRNAKARIAHLLCEIAVRLGAPVNEGSFAFLFPVTQIQLADATGLTSVHVNRVLKALRGEGLIDVGRRESVVRDWGGLVEAGEFNPNYLQRNIEPEERMRIIHQA